jgi:hypothetical protein
LRVNDTQRDVLARVLAQQVGQGDLSPKDQKVVAQLLAVLRGEEPSGPDDGYGMDSEDGLAPHFLDPDGSSGSPHLDEGSGEGGTPHFFDDGGGYSGI